MVGNIINVFTVTSDQFNMKYEFFPTPNVSSVSASAMENHISEDH